MVRIARGSARPQSVGVGEASGLGHAQLEHRLVARVVDTSQCALPRFGSTGAQELARVLACACLGEIEDNGLDRIVGRCVVAPRYSLCVLPLPGLSMAAGVREARTSEDPPRLLRLLAERCEGFIHPDPRQARCAPRKDLSCERRCQTGKAVRSVMATNDKGADAEAA